METTQHRYKQEHRIEDCTRPPLFACRQLTPALESHFGLRDTCGVHNLHGMPGLLGGIVAAVVSWTSYGGNKGVMLAGHKQVLSNATAWHPKTQDAEKNQQVLPEHL